ncbi:MAG: hypothetical protein FRX49_03177 [Trebouxia sp. A1-2]|nr:MAG: hypothetical protein FRX49_03177 [Trebouxia sp. A1-2]
MGVVQREPGRAAGLPMPAPALVWGWVLPPDEALLRVGGGAITAEDCFDTGSGIPEDCLEWGAATAEVCLDGGCPTAEGWRDSGGTAAEAAQHQEEEQQTEAQQMGFVPRPGSQPETAATAVVVAEQKLRRLRAVLCHDLGRQILVRHISKACQLCWAGLLRWQDKGGGPCNTTLFPRDSAGAVRVSCEPLLMVAPLRSATGLTGSSSMNGLLVIMDRTRAAPHDMGLYTSGAEVMPAGRTSSDWSRPVSSKYPSPYGPSSDCPSSECLQQDSTAVAAAAAEHVTCYAEVLTQSAGSFFFLGFSRLSMQDWLGQQATQDVFSAGAAIGLAVLNAAFNRRIMAAACIKAKNLRLQQQGGDGLVAAGKNVCVRRHLLVLLSRTGNLLQAMHGAIDRIHTMLSGSVKPSADQSRVKGVKQ